MAINDTLTVIASHDFPDYLSNLLDSIARLKVNTDVLVVDTGSTDPSYHKYIESINNTWKVEKSDGRNYEFGANVHGFKRYKDAYKYFFFIHDSVEILVPDIIERFKKRFLESRAGAISWGRVEPEQNTQYSSYLRRLFGTDRFHTTGPFGCMFFTSSVNLQKLEDKGFFNTLPTNKLESEAMERGWAIAYELCNMSILPLYKEEDWAKLPNRQLPEMRKNHLSRLGRV